MLCVSLVRALCVGPVLCSGVDVLGFSCALPGMPCVCVSTRAAASLCVSTRAAASLLLCFAWHALRFEACYAMLCSPFGKGIAGTRGPIVHNGGVKILKTRC